VLSRRLSGVGAAPTHHHPKEAPTNLPNALWQMLAMEVTVFYMNAQGLQENFSNGRTSRHQVRTYAELQEQLHHDLMAQHPEWIDADGNCPTCESYDRRLAELISSFQSVNRKSMAQAA